MSREEAINRWESIIPTVFRAEDKLRPELQKLLKEYEEKDKSAGARIYIRRIAEEIVSKTSDKELAEL